MNTMIEKFKGTVKLDKLLLDIALIYKRELKDTMKAKETMQRIIKEYPNSQSAKTAKALLERPAGK
mgnify:CR=1 FL=1